MHAWLGCWPMQKSAPHCVLQVPGVWQVHWPNALSSTCAPFGNAIAQQSMHAPKVVDAAHCVAPPLDDDVDPPDDELDVAPPDDELDDEDDDEADGSPPPLPLAMPPDGEPLEEALLFGAFVEFWFWVEPSSTGGGALEQALAATTRSTPAENPSAA